jgi:superfamily II DNA or RNA helicase
MAIPHFSEKDLGYFFDSGALARGLAYQQNGHVVGLKINPDNETMRGTVTGNRDIPYRTHVLICRDNGKLYFEGDCSCPVVTNCKHSAATIYQYLHRQKQNSTVLATSHKDKKNAVTTHLSEAFQHWSEQAQNQAKLQRQQAALGTHTLVFELILKDHGNVGEFPELILQTMMVKTLKSGKLGARKPLKLSSQKQLSSLSPKSAHWLGELMAAALLGASTSSEQFAFYRLNHPQYIPILKRILAQDLCYLRGETPLLLSLGETLTSELLWTQSPKKDGLVLSLSGISDHLKLVQCGGSLWYLNDKLGECAPVKCPIPTSRLAILLNIPPVTPALYQWANDQMNKLPDKKQLPKLPKLTEHRQIKAKLTPVLRLFEHAIRIERGFYNETASELALGELLFDYDNTRISADSTSEHAFLADDDTLISIARDIPAENKARKVLSQFKLCTLEQFAHSRHSYTQFDDCFVLDSGDHDLNYFMQNTLPTLKQAGFIIEIDESFAYLPTVEAPDNWFANLEEGNQYNWFGMELGVMLDGKRVNLLPILQLYIQQQGPDILFQLENSDPGDKVFLSAPEAGVQIAFDAERLYAMLNVLFELFDQASFNERGQLDLSARELALIKQLHLNTDNIHIDWENSADLVTVANQLYQPETCPNIQIPDDFKATLRPYQQVGLNWLQCLHAHGFSGILADDMGLGKTVQALAHIALEKTAGRLNKGCLIVAPTSLMFNWEAEVARFAPTLSLLKIHGQDRHALFDKLDHHDILLTTYPLLLRDQAVWVDREFDLIILDEAQMIKNKQAKVAQAASKLTATNRLCLTGTPIENNLAELWSLFHFLMPGFLGAYHRFKQRFQEPIELEGDTECQAQLAQRVAPFILRRTKADVLKELPPKTNILRYVEMADEQADLYETLRLSMHKTVRDTIASLGIEKSQIIVLDALLKLRQTCCDPRLLKIAAAKKAHHISAKLDVFENLVKSLASEKRKILVFSQFTSMLDLIEQKLNDANIESVMLTGQTKDRKKPIDAFQKGDVPVFLISLKAGGVGLNLTAADTVIHYDPWWNPAAETQATDRAHRIGQDKPVFVYKLIVKNSVEDTILKMQDNKRALVDGLFAETNAKTKSRLSDNDLAALFAPL